MPTYEYACEACGHTMEAFQSITANPLRKCPACGKMKLKRLIGTGAGIIFKGSGFYETDYRSESYTKAAEAENKAAQDSSDTSKSDSKSDQSQAKSDTAKSDQSSGESKSNSAKKETSSPAK